MMDLFLGKDHPVQFFTGTLVHIIKKGGQDWLRVHMTEVILHDPCNAKYVVKLETITYE